MFFLHRLKHVKQSFPSYHKNASMLASQLEASIVTVQCRDSISQNMTNWSCGGPKSLRGFEEVGRTRANAEESADQHSEPGFPVRCWRRCWREGVTSLLSCIQVCRISL